MEFGYLSIILKFYTCLVEYIDSFPDVVCNTYSTDI